jgi:hypothetical protein
MTPVNLTGFRRSHLILILATSVLLAGIPVIAQTASDPNAGDERFQRTFTLHSGGAVVISNDRGKTVIEGWDKDQVVVDVVKRFEHGSDSERAAWMRETQVRFSNDPSRVQINVELPHRLCMTSCNWNAGVDLTLHVPRRVQLDLQSDRGGIGVASIEGNLRIRSDRGSIDIDHVTGGIHVTADRGSVRMRDVDARGALDVRVDRGNIEFQGSLTQDGNLASERGNILVRLPENVKLQLEVAQDRRSHFRTDFPVSTSGSFGSGTVRGSINGGGPTLRMRAGRGSVSLEKSNRAII